LCDCPDFAFHRDGIDADGCKHNEAMVAVGLSPFGLTAEVWGDEIAVIPRRPGIVPVAPSARQREAAARLEGMLGNPITFNLRGTTLADVVKTLAERTGEPITLDPVGRRDRPRGGRDRLRWQATAGRGARGAAQAARSAAPNSRRGDPPGSFESPVAGR
jgi:hypothetical protein